MYIGFLSCVMKIITHCFKLYAHEMILSARFLLNLKNRSKLLNILMHLKPRRFVFQVYVHCKYFWYKDFLF